MFYTIKDMNEKFFKDIDSTESWVKYIGNYTISSFGRMKRKDAFVCPSPDGVYSIIHDFKKVEITIAEIKKKFDKPTAKK